MSGYVFSVIKFVRKIITILATLCDVAIVVVKVPKLNNINFESSTLLWRM